MWHNFNKSRENVALFVESYTLFSFWSAIIIRWGLQSFDIFVYIYQKKDNSHYSMKGRHFCLAANSVSFFVIIKNCLKFCL